MSCLRLSAFQCVGQALPNISWTTLQPPELFSLLLFELPNPTISFSNNFFFHSSLTDILKSNKNNSTRNNNDFQMKVFPSAKIMNSRHPFPTITSSSSLP